jgi:hypothetical protein
MRDEIRQIRERVKGLSGFWIGEASAAVYALEWAMGKRESPPSEDLNRPHGGREKIAASLVKIVEAAPAGRLKPTAGRAVKPSSRPSSGKRSTR